MSQPRTRNLTVANSPPTVEFEPNCQDLDCDFDNNSADADGTIVAWSWSFGDDGPGSTSDQPAPSHSYAAAGTYTVTLTVTDDQGASAGPVSRQVDVSDPLPNVAPSADFAAPTCKAGVACSFNDGSTDPDGGIATRKWDFGDGTALVETAQDPVAHTYAGTGVYQVTLSVTDDEGAESAPVVKGVTVNQNALPVAGFTAPACTAGVSCSFQDQSTDDGSVVTRRWDFGDPPGTVVSTGNASASHTFTLAGNYTVTLTVVDNDGATSNPAAQHTVTVSAAPNAPPTAAFTSSCSGLTCAFTNGSSDGDGSIVSRSWNFGDGATSTANSPSRTYAAGGTYTVRLTVTDDDGGTATVTHSVTVNAPAPNRLPTALFGSACTGLNCSFTDRSTDPDGNNTVVAWSWSFGDGTSSTARNPSHAFGARGSYKVKLTVTDNRGGSDPITHTVTVAP